MEGVRFVHECELEGVRTGIRREECPFCRRAGTLICHGFLSGYDEQRQPVRLRGARFLCSNRRRSRPGCGRTFSVLLSDVLPRRIVSVVTLLALLTLLAEGVTRHGAWKRLPAKVSLSTVYRTASRLKKSLSHMRTSLHGLCEPPAAGAGDSVWRQTLAHLEHAFAGASCPACAFQHRLQREMLA